MGASKKHRKPLRLGMPVHALDGEAGKISKIITDPESRQATYLAVKTGRLLSRKEVVIPVSLVSKASAEAVFLKITREALADYPVYEVTVVKGQYQKPQYFPRGLTIPAYYLPDNRGYMVLRQRSVPEQSIAVEKGMQVRDCNGQQAGEVEGVILDQAKRQGKYIVFRRDHSSPLQLIPADLIQNISSAEVKLRIDGKSIEKLAEYSERSIRNSIAAAAARGAG